MPVSEHGVSALDVVTAIAHPLRAPHCTHQGNVSLIPKLVRTFISILHHPDALPNEKQTETLLYLHSTGCGLLACHGSPNSHCLNR